MTPWEAKALLDFIRESNAIEDLHHPVSLDELETYERFLSRVVINPSDLELFVAAVQPGAKLRVKPGMDVKVGNYFAPPGEPSICTDLAGLLFVHHLSPYKLYIKYQLLHPFTDGNGRSGRALWLHAMRATGKGDLALGLGFLKCFHYATLEKASGVKMIHG